MEFSNTVKTLPARPSSCTKVITLPMQYETIRFRVRVSPRSAVAKNNTITINITTVMLSELLRPSVLENTEISSIPM